MGPYQKKMYDRLEYFVDHKTDDEDCIRFKPHEAYYLMKAVSHFDDPTDIMDKNTRASQSSIGQHFEDLKNKK